jgi:hypothetical protein
MEVIVVIEPLEIQACARLPMDAPIGASVNAAATAGGHRIEVVLRVDRHGNRVYTYMCDGARMARLTLAMLLCPETACPRGQQVKSRWREFTGQPSPRTRHQPQTLQVRPLIEEVVVESAGHRCTARPASFECLTPCPVGAHGPELMRKAGWDLFEDGVWIAGGLQKEPRSGYAEPTFATPADAAGWLSDQQVKAYGVLEQVR